MKKITISTAKPYDIVLGAGTISNITEYIKEHFSPPRKVCIITDSNVSSLYSESVLNQLIRGGFDAFRIVFPAGEHSKNLTTYSNILESLADAGMSRSDFILALGGGVVGDLAGFIAGTYMRGIDYVFIPTTLLAAVDSSIGGKTGVNILGGKNLSGLFWQPSLVISDPDTLSTLPEKHLIDGTAEAVKAAVVSDATLIGYIQEKNWEYVIERCISIKKSLVEVDEHDTGLRQLLYYGHTLAHGIEKISSYEITHGRAVAKGLVGEARAAHAMGYSNGDISVELSRVLTSLGFDTSLDYDPEELYQMSLTDKKIRDGMINIIVPEVIGKCVLRKIDFKELKKFIQTAVD